MTDPTSHPEELLAAYTDGDLEDDRRAELEAHLTTCDRCRNEVRLARSARDALGALPELDVPTGTLRPVERSIAERTQPPAAKSGSRSSRREHHRRDPARVLAGLAIAAVLVILGGIVLTPLLRGGGGVSNEEAALAGAPGHAAPAKTLWRADISHLPSPSVQQQNVDYDGVSIQAVALAAARDPVRFARSGSQQLVPAPVNGGAASLGGVSPGGNAASGGGAGGAAVPSGTPTAEPSTVDQAGGTAGDSSPSFAQRLPRSEAKSVTDCVAQWSRGRGIVQKNLHALRIVRATYLGSPATVAVYLQTAGGGTPGKVLIWVLDSDCRLVSFVQRAL